MMTNLPSLEELDESVASNFKKIDHRHTELSWLINSETASTIKMTASTDTKVKRLIGVIHKISDIIEPIVACKKGCSHCCNMAVGISHWEATRIGKFITRPPAKLKPLNYAEQAEFIHDIDKFKGVPCPFLVNHTCSIYEVRPLACMTNFNISDYPQICDLQNTEIPVPTINLTKVWEAAAEVCIDPAIFGDIRTFFPPEAKPL